MSLTRTYAIALRHFYLMRGSFSRVLPLFIWVGLDIVLWGFITKYLSRITDAGMNLVPQFLGAVVFWGFFIRVLQGVTLVYMEDVWSRNFFNIFASPITIPEYLGGLILSSIATSMVGLIAMLIIATGFFGLSFLSYGIALFPFLLILFLFGIAIGILGCAVMLRFGPAAEWFVWPIPAVIAPFVGVFYPLSVLPVWMQYFSWLLPPAYVFEGMRAIVAGQGVSMMQLSVGALLAIFYILLTCFAFTWVYRHALRTGLIARYSAETLS